VFAEQGMHNRENMAHGNNGVAGAIKKSGQPIQVCHGKISIEQ
jgi:hypothetical protein